jgi:uncharacterized phage-like protein YoqJ
LQPNNYNACSLGPQTKEEAKKLNWHRLDCLTANKLKIETDSTKILVWFEKQDEEWKAARKARLKQRINSRRIHY